MKIRPIHLLVALVVSLLMWGAAIGGGAAVADRLITGHDVKDGTIRKADLGAGVQAKLDKKAARGARGPAGARGLVGPQGPKGDAGPSGLTGAYWATAAYDAGDTNAGAIATVACSKISDVAIAGGVQTLGLGGHPAAVASSFPGRMDWSTNTPKPDRLDGWIVQFDADVAPEKATIWALCVPQSVAVVETYRQSS